MPPPRLAEALSASYWAALDDALSSSDTPLAGPPWPADDTLVEQLADEGIAVVPGAVDEATLARVRHAIDVVTAGGWPRVFAWLYDAAWACVRAPRVHAALASVLGAGYRQTAGVWLHEVAARDGARGWAPHVDTAGHERFVAGAPRRLTAWLALTDATLDNGCIHYVPARVTGDLADRFEAMERMDAAEAMQLLQETRAVPVAAGTLLLWRTDLLHWGGTTTARAAAPRLALSFEAAHERAPPRADERPALDPAAPVSFAERLSLVGRGLLAYGKSREREPFAHGFTELGEELCDRWLDDA